MQLCNVDAFSHGSHHDFPVIQSLLNVEAETNAGRCRSWCAEQRGYEKARDYLRSGHPEEYLNQVLGPLRERFPNDQDLSSKITAMQSAITIDRLGETMLDETTLHNAFEEVDRIVGKGAILASGNDYGYTGDSESYIPAQPMRPSSPQSRLTSHPIAKPNHFWAKRAKFLTTGLCGLSEGAEATQLAQLTINAPDMERTQQAAWPPVPEMPLWPLYDLQPSTSTSQMPSMFLGSLNIRTCHILILLGILTIVGSLAPALWRSIYGGDISGGFSLAQYILGVGVFVVGSMVAIHSKSCKCWK